VVMDLTMPGMGGLEAMRQINENHPQTRVLVLSSHAEEEHLLHVLEAGGSGYVRKTQADQDLISAIRTVSRGEVFLYPSATRLLLKSYRNAEARGEANPLEELSGREREVLTALAGGQTGGDIARQLFIAPDTVRRHVANAREKLNARTRAHAIAEALRRGEIGP